MNELTSGQRVRFLRALYGLTRTDFADKLNVPSSTLRNWESRANPELPYKACQNIYSRLSEEVAITFEWLRAGIGPDPDIIVDDGYNEFESLAQVIIDCEKYVKAHGASEHEIRYVANDDWAPFVFLGDVIIGRKQTDTLKQDEGFSMYVDSDGLEHFGFFRDGTVYISKNEDSILDKNLVAQRYIVVYIRRII
ncbi:hypothetical protein GTG28_20030 [Vibrio sp. OCN044]|uniref:HTH cro/C1-type domain-containing protein n=1 Tax=Vibrio tetraodonis subsp. pristinus TaxID=2695891 RepID=A0A6L8M2L0_9VIBR|nr:hypothetical protein [Vibrio tetraodonis]MYM61500.1 hypothetical protein [Vibrio tetraodonis subsp. pristinus]